jgi:peptide/nickel transport system permease protein
MISSVGSTRVGAGASTSFRAITSLVRNPRVTPVLIAGALLLFAVLLFSFIGPLFVNQKHAIVGTVPPNLHPSSAHLFGTDALGRDVLVFVVMGTWPTLKIGLIAGGVGVGIGIVLGLLAGYFRGTIDAFVRVIADSLMTVPAIAILALIAASVQQMTVNLLGLTVAALAWMVPTRTIRAQVLSVRERGYVEVARANGERELELLFREVLPNLIPYIAASFVAAIGAGILAAIGLEALGLGVGNVPTLGTTIFWSVKYSAVLTGEWWWWTPPIIIIGIIFISLFMLSAGLDRFANPRIGPRS